MTTGFLVCNYELKEKTEHEVKFFITNLNMGNRIPICARNKIKIHIWQNGTSSLLRTDKQTNKKPACSIHYVIYLPRMVLAFWIGTKNSPAFFTLRNPGNRTIENHRKETVSCRSWSKFKKFTVLQFFCTCLYMVTPGNWKSINLYCHVLLYCCIQAYSDWLCCHMVYTAPSLWAMT